MQISNQCQWEVLNKLNGHPVLFHPRYPSSSFFTDYNPRNLTLLYDGLSIYGAIGSLEDRYFMGATTQEWHECEVATLTDNSETMRMTFYKVSYNYTTFGISN